MQQKFKPGMQLMIILDMHYRADRNNSTKMTVWRNKSGLMQEDFCIFMLNFSSLNLLLTLYRLTATQIFTDKKILTYTAGDVAVLGATEDVNLDGDLHYDPKGSWTFLTSQL